MRRVTETAQHAGVAAESVDELRDSRFGPGAPDSAIILTERLDQTLWRSTDGFPGGETLEAFHRRAGAWLDDVVSRHSSAPHHRGGAVTR